MTKLVEILKDSPVILFKSCYKSKKGPLEIFMAVAKRIILLPLRGEDHGLFHPFQLQLSLGVGMCPRLILV